MNILPVSKTLFCTAFAGLIKNNLRQNRKYCIEMTTRSNWKEEKNRLLTLPIEEKRKLYKQPQYIISLNTVDTWAEYAAKHSLTKTKLEEDITEFKKITLNPEQNRRLATKVSIFKGDITRLEVDAIVNAANSLLRAGGGVDGAIHKAAGPLLQEECLSLNGCPTGDAKVTGGYDLPAKYVIHTVGPQDKSASQLQSCYEKCLKFKKEYNLKSIAFPCISTGVYGFPNNLAAHIALRSARQFLEHNNEFERIVFCTFMSVDVGIYEKLMQLYFPLEIKKE